MRVPKFVKRGGEKKQMKNRKVYGVLAIVIIAGLLSTVIPFASATPSTPVSGQWVAVPGSQVYSNIRAKGANYFIDVYNKGTYTAGDMLGSFEQTFNVVIHYRSPQVVANLNPNPALRPEAPFIWYDMERTFTGTVLGVSGGFTMRLEAIGYGNSYEGPAYFNLRGTWVIISGTGGLANLHGQGTWWHSSTGFAGLEYQGQVHFDQ